MPGTAFRPPPPPHLPLPLWGPRPLLGTAGLVLPVADNFTGTNGAAPDPAKWSRTTDGTTTINIQNNALSLVSDASGNVGHVRLNISPTGDQEFLGIVEAGADNSWLWLLLRASGFTAGTPTGGYLLEVTANGQWLYRRVGGVATFLVGASGGTGLAAGERRWMRFQTFTNGAQVDIRFRQWAVGSTEPSAWALEWPDTDAARILSGVPALVVGDIGSYLVDDVSYAATQQPSPPGGAALTATGQTASAGTATLALAKALTATGATASAGTATLGLGGALAATGQTASGGTATLALAKALTAIGITTSGGQAGLGVVGPTDTPDAIVAAVNLDTLGRLPALWADDALWLTAIDPAASTDLLVSFPTPAAAPASGGPVRFQVQLRKTTGTPDPTVDLELWEAGSYRTRLAAGVAITSTVGQVVEASFDPSLLTDPTGAGVQLRIVTPYNRWPATWPATWGAP